MLFINLSVYVINIKFMFYYIIFIIHYYSLFIVTLFISFYSNLTIFSKVVQVI